MLPQFLAIAVLMSCRVVSFNMQPLTFTLNSFKFRIAGIKLANISPPLTPTPSLNEMSRVRYSKAFNDARDCPKTWDQVALPNEPPQIREKFVRVACWDSCMTLEYKTSVFLHRKSWKLSNPHTKVPAPALVHPRGSSGCSLHVPFDMQYPCEEQS